MLDAVLALVERVGADGEPGAGGPGRPLRLEAGQVLIREGDVSDTVYVLLEGELVVSRQVDGRRVVLSSLTAPGTVVGEMVVMGGGRRSATIAGAATSRLVAFAPDAFRALIETEPEVAAALAAAAVRRAEETELVELLAGHFEITDPAALEATGAAAQWHRLGQGEVLFSEGEASDLLYFVVSGRLLATRYDPTDATELQLGTVGRGDVVGEVGLLRRSPRNATVTALRDSVLASLSEGAFLDLVDLQPRVMVGVGLRAVDRAVAEGRRSSPSTVLAVALGPGTAKAEVIEALRRQLARFGTVEVLSAPIVDRLLDSPGIADTPDGEFGAMRVGRLLHESEIEADHLLLDVGFGAGPWSRRCLGMADRVLVVVAARAADAELGRARDLLGGSPRGLNRTAVIVHGPGTRRPSGSRSTADRLGADEVLHIGADPGELQRVARVAVGRANVVVLGGGGGRGFAHLGVVQALQEQGFPIDIVGGTSIGGIIAAAIADGMSPDEVIDWAGRHFARALDYTLPVVSLIKGGRIARSAIETFGDRDIEDLWLGYFAISTDLSTSRVHVHRSGPLPPAIRATSAIPGVMPPVPVGDRLLVDGGVLNNLPVDVARELAPAGTVVAVDVAPPRGPGAKRDYGLSVSGWQALRAGKQYPGITAVLMRSMITASMRERDAQVLAGLADCYLDLDMRGISMFDFTDPAGVARRGYEAAMPEIEAWLGGRAPR